MPVEEDEERLLFGMDAEQAQKMKDKLNADPDYSKKALQWVEALIGEKMESYDVYSSLKSGIVLCKLANQIKPGIIRLINMKPLAVCERENIKSYIKACHFIGVSKDELFDVSDLHDKKSLNAVVLSIYALGRVVQTISSFTGPTLGVKYNVTIEDRNRRETIKVEERKIAQEKFEEYEQERKERREELEDEKVDRRKRRDDTIREKIKGRRIKKGRKINTGSQRLSAGLSVSPVKYGMDNEHQKMLEERQLAADAEYEDKALDWIEEITGAELDDFYKSLRSGIVLCDLANCIQPGIVPKINKRNLPAVHRENIQLYLNSCTKFGISTHEMFTVPDLYDRRMISAVVVNIYALARLVEGKVGATLSNRGGKSIMITKKTTVESRRSLRRSGSFSKLGASGSVSKFSASGSTSKFGASTSPQSKLRASQSIRANPSLTEPLLENPNEEPKKQEGGCGCCTIL